MHRSDQEHWTAREVSRLLSLVESERRYFQELVASLPVGIAALNRDLTFVSSNRAFRQIFGLRVDLVYETQLSHLNLEGIPAAAAQVVEAGGDFATFVPAAETPGGTRPLRIRLSRLRDWEDTEGDEILMVVEDLSGPVEQARAEANAAATRYQEQASRLPALVWEGDLASGAFVSVNTGAIPALRLNAEHWVPGAPLWGERIAEQDREAIRNIFQNGAPRLRNLSCDYRSPSGNGVTWMRDAMTIEGNRIFGVTTDISWQRARDEAGAQYRKVEALTRLSGRVVHDCNNLLMITGGYGEELMHSLAPENPLRGNVQQILTASDRLGELTRTLTAYVKHPSPERQDFAIDPLLADLRGELERGLPAGQRLTIEFGCAGAAASGDPALIVHAVKTLVERAAASARGAGVIAVSTAMFEAAAHTSDNGSLLPPGSYATVSVRDRGHEIHPDLLAQIFEPLGPQGLAQFGLPAIYKSICEMGGDLRAESVFGAGTTFTILLPANHVAQAAPPESIEPEAAPVEAAKTVLVVEDEAGIRTLMRRILDREGYQLLEAGHGKAALELARNHPGVIDLLVTDVVMPEMSGFDLARSLRAIRPGLKVLFISGYTGLSGVDPEQLKEGSAFLQKPFTLNAFVSKVHELLNGNG